jgi:hypothetical protein
MKSVVFSALFVLSQFQAVYAEPVAVDQMPRLPEIDANVSKEAFDRDALVNHLKATFSQINSFAFSEKRTQESEGYWALCWREIGDKYCYELISGNEIDVITAFDGKRRSVWKGGEIIFTKNGDLPARRPTNLPSPLDIYAFLNVNGKYLSMNELGPDSSVWNDLSERITYGGHQQFIGRDCIMARVSGIFNYAIKQYADYDVFFDPATSIPLGWRSYDSQRFMIEQLEAFDFKTITGKANSSSFTYPSHCKVTEYQWPGTITGPGGVVRFYKSVRDERYDDVIINDLTPAEVQINPSLAKEIIDEDAKVVTQISK